MDKLQKAYSIVIKFKVIRTKDLAELMNIEKNEARGVMRLLSWLGVVTRHDSIDNGCYYTVTP